MHEWFANWEEDYKDRLTAVFEKHAPEKVSNIPVLIEEQITKGSGLQNYYEQVCHEFELTADKEVRRDTL